ncbi:Stk1 family PASTA domain-containing Ser/Thr kinase [Rothia sp. ZJ932]|uniref:Stk1 family PASTA domain-containing Ser/Thr kinase n=1 Tax=Rothia sp. ZJ932 TaxID=2810516 RepID=UPI001966E3C1|nr:Stk1 family PASTA domain-containing Ser/Thr kinase [Rothia sp. ZJ932]QRZ61528.1 Stk1 family PASTA domain-containing Ser/Thr kinase [Rothia sp. ZJ932]
MELNIPDTVDQRYSVGEVIGSGAMATVYAATDNRLGRQVALKVLRPEIARDEAARVRFAREGESVASLNHAGIVAVYDTGSVSVEDSGEQVEVPYLVMELVHGKSLRDVLRGGGVSVADAAVYGVQLMDALDCSHSAGVIHRDVKPGNLMVLEASDDDRKQGIPGRIKVMDFGIARAAMEGEPLTQANMVLGTPRYISPEHASGAAVDERSDVYSAAVVLYEMVAGRAPFTGDVASDLLSKHLSEDPKAPSFYAKREVPVELDRVILKALSKDPASRYQSAAEFRNALVHATHSLLPTSILENLDNAPATTAFTPVETPIPTSKPGVGAAMGAGAVAASSAATPASASSATPPTGEVAGLGSIFTDAQDEYSREEVLEYGRDEELLRKSRRRRAWGRFLSGLIIFLLAASCIGIVLYYNNKLNEVPTVAVPSVTGQMQAEAENTLRNAGLQVEHIEDFSDNVPRGQAIGTVPVVGTAVDENSMVTLKVSKGNEQIKVPGDLAGQSEAYVREALTKANLVPGRVSTVNDPTIPAGLVVAVEPGEGESVKAESTVNIVLSTGKVEVPDLVGLTRDQAIAALTGPDTLLSTNIENVQTTSAPAGTVMSQSAAPGTSIEQGSTVTIRIANAPTPTAAAAPATPSAPAASNAPSAAPSAPANPNAPAGNAPPAPSATASAANRAPAAPSTAATGGANR